MSFLVDVIKIDARPHRHKRFEIIVCTKGEGVSHLESGDYALSVGKMLIIPPGTLHSATGSGDYERIYINGELSHIFNLSSPIVVSDNAEGEGLMLAKKIYENRYNAPEYAAMLTYALAYYLVRSRKVESEVGVAIDEIIKKITLGFYDSTIDLSAVLRKSGYAEDYIRAQFKKATGKTPNGFLTDVRMDHARHLIDIYTDTLPLSDIAMKCGYTDYVYFSKKFKQVVGVSPRQYLHNNR